MHFQVLYRETVDMGQRHIRWFPCVESVTFIACCASSTDVLPPVAVIPGVVHTKCDILKGQILDWTFRHSLDEHSDAAVDLNAIESDIPDLAYERIRMPLYNVHEDGAEWPVICPSVLQLASRFEQLSLCAEEVWAALNKRQINPDDIKTITVEWYKKLIAEGVEI